MRTLYITRTADGTGIKGFALNEEDLHEILAAHFGLNPDTLTIRGLRIEGTELSVSGATPEPEPSPSVAM